MGDLGQVAAAERVVLEHTVPHGAGDGTDPAALARPVGRRDERFTTRAPDDAVVDLVRLDHRTVGQDHRRSGQHLLEPERSVDRQQAETGDGPRTRLDTVLDRRPEHLVAAADAEHRSSGSGVASNGDVDASLAHPRQVADGGTRAGQDDQIGVDELRRLIHEADHDTRFERQGVDVGVVAHAGEGHDVDPEHIVTERRRTGTEQLEVDGVLGVDPETPHEGQHPERRASGQVRQHVEARLEQGHIARACDDGPAINAWSAA